MESNLTAKPIVQDILSETIFKYVVPLATWLLLLANVTTHLLYHRQLRTAVNTLREVYRTLDSKPQVLKILALLVSAIYWPLPPVWFLTRQFTHTTLMLLLFIDLQISFFAYLVEDAFWVLKGKVKELYKLLIQTSEVKGFLLYFDEPCTKLGKQPGVDLFKLRQVHRQLCGVMTTVNGAYNICTLIGITSKRFFFTLYLYRWITSGFASIELWYSIFQLHWILYLCYRLEALKTVGKETAKMINGFDKSALDIKTRAELKLFSIQLRSLRMVISPIQMFNLNFTLITSMFTSTITYLMLLQQFK